MKGAALLLPLGLLASPAAAQTTRVDPYIEVEQVLFAGLNDGSDNVTTSTGIAAGVVATAATARTQASADVRYEHFFGYDDGLSDQDILTGIARGRTQLVPNLLALEGGALASRSTFGGGDGGFGIEGVDGSTELYSVYLGPQLATTVDGIGLTAGYRFGYTRVEQDVGGGVLTPFGLSEDSTSHVVTASASARPGRLAPVGVTLSGTYEREDADPLDQRFELANVRADLTYPLSRTLALVGGVGYESIEVSRRRALAGADGLPVLNGNGELVADPNAPRLLAYDIDGLIYDGGLLWRPSPRTQVEARVGHRYGGTTFTGAGTWQFSRSGALSVVVFDQVDTFGRSLTRSLARLPVAFNVVRGGFNNDLLGCVFGEEGTGGCIDPLTNAYTASAFRSRGVSAVLSRSRGTTSYGIGAGYTRRTFQAPDFGQDAFVYGSADSNVYLNGFYSTRLGPRERLGLYGTANWYDPDGPLGDVFSLSGQADYSYLITRRLTAGSSFGLYYFDPDGFADQLTAAARVALRYGF